MDVDVDLLDDPAGLVAADVGGMLPAIASSAAQIRRGVTAVADSGVDLSALGRPRSVIVAGMGGSGLSADVLAALAGAGSSVPILAHRGYSLPGWVGAHDVVVAVSCSGGTEETLSAADRAARVGAHLVGIGAADSPLEAVVARAGGDFVPTTVTHSPRASLFSLATPLLLLARQMGLLTLADDDVEAAAVRLEQIAVACRAESETFMNPAKDLAVALAGSLPMVWGGPGIAQVAAYRFGCQWAENAKSPAVVGSLPEADHNQIVTVGGPLSAPVDIFADDAGVRQVLVLLDGGDDDERIARRREISGDVAEAGGMRVIRLAADGVGPYERFASLVGLIDYASTYAALAMGVDPSPIGPIDALKAAMAGQG